MSRLPDTVSVTFSSAYEQYAGRVRALSGSLTDDQFWTKPYPYGNSFGHLVLHLTGNLNYFIGTEIAGTGYVRDREREFTDTSKRPKVGVLRDFDAAIEMVLATVNAQTAESWSEPYTATGSDHSDRFSIVLHCAAHLNHHVGQMIYLEKELHKADLRKADPRTTDPRTTDPRTTAPRTTAPHKTV